MRESVKKLIREKKVALVIGYAKGTLPLYSTPYLIKDEKDANNLIFDITCDNNLAKYLVKNRSPRTKNRENIGIIAKGCDGRAIVNLIVEGQIKREEITIIGVPCEGVINKRKLREKIGAKDILRYEIEGKKVVIEGRNFRTSLDKLEILSDSCLICKYPNPPVYDLFIGEPASVIGNRLLVNGKTGTPKTESQKPNAKLEFLNKFEKMNSDERWAYFEHEISKCIRCYACRNACPMCYCEECIVDRSNPQWFGKSIEFSDTLLFHIIRILDTVGRCVLCGACARACPTGVNLIALNIELEKEIKERFGYTTGLSIDTTPPMATYDEADKQEFIM